MGLFDNLESQAETIAAKVGISADQVRAVANSVQANLTSSEGNPAAALEAAAAQHGISVGTIHEILNMVADLKPNLATSRAVFSSLDNSRANAFGVNPPWRNQSVRPIDGIGNRRRM